MVTVGIEGKELRPIQGQKLIGRAKGRENPMRYWTNDESIIVKKGMSGKKTERGDLLAVQSII